MKHFNFKFQLERLLRRILVWSRFFNLPNRFPKPSFANRLTLFQFAIFRVPNRLRQAFFLDSQTSKTAPNWFFLRRVGVHLSLQTCLNRRLQIFDRIAKRHIGCRIAADFERRNNERFYRQNSPCDWKHQTQSLKFCKRKRCSCGCVCLRLFLYWTWVSEKINDLIDK